MLSLHPFLFDESVIVKFDMSVIKHQDNKSTLFKSILLTDSPQIRRATLLNATIPRGSKILWEYI